MQLGVLSLVLSAQTISLCAVSAETVKFAKYEGRKEMAYALDILAPWANAGKLTINFPEHLQFKTTGKVAILAEYEKDMQGWVIGEDGLSASLDVESRFQPGVKIKATAKVVDGLRVDFSFALVHGGKAPLPDLVPFFCHHYGFLTGFARENHFKHVHVLQDSKLVALADLPAAKADASVRGAYVTGCPQQPSGVKDFSGKYGGFVEKPLDRALVALTSAEGKRKILLAWTPGMYMLSNSSIPCIHADPFLGSLEPGKSVEVKGVLIFTEGSLDEAVAALVKEGAGAPPKNAAK